MPEASPFGCRPRAAWRSALVLLGLSGCAPSTGTGYDARSDAGYAGAGAGGCTSAACGAGGVAGASATGGLAGALTATGGRAEEPILPLPVFGTLQSDPSRAKEMYADGFRLTTLELGWDLFEPRDGEVDETYVAAAQARLLEFRQAGMRVVLEAGRHYPPSWVFEVPHSRFVNQYGAVYTELESGRNVGNVVYNQALRDLHARYLEQVFARLGTDFYAVRVGGGWYGELNYPPHEYAGQTNCYWAFDAIAQGNAGGMADGVRVAPHPGYKPGEPSTNHSRAHAFAEWYLESLADYHDWQIRTVRRFYSGTIVMLYPSWGLRPGQLEAAVQADLAGSTLPEAHGEVSRGFDFARFVARIDDAKMTPYSTWLDAPAPEDGLTDPSGWSPVHYLASLAAEHPLSLSVWGENTGGGGAPVMATCFERVRQHDLRGFMWAFEPELYAPSAAAEEFRRQLAVP